MKDNTNSQAVLRVLSIPLLVILTLVSTSRAQGQVNDSKASAQRGLTGILDKVDRLTGTLNRAGFNLQEGQFLYVDTVKEMCQGNLPDAAGNNPWPNAYLALKMPQVEGYAPPPFYMYWQLREDEAMLLVGETPPAAEYFSYQTFVGFWPNDATRRAVPIGDTANNVTIRTTGKDRASRPIVYIVTGNRTTEARLRTAVRTAGFPDSIVNVETISPIIAPLGLGKTGSYFVLGQRIAAPESETALESYIMNPPYRAFRVTPESPLAPDPEPLPVLRVRGTGHTEMGLWPAMKRLRQAILDREKADHPALVPQEGTSRTWQANLHPTAQSPDGQLELVDKPFAGLQLNNYVWLASRDTNYFQTYPYIKLRQGVDEYMIVYGVNHKKTGKATYANFSAYADPKTASNEAEGKHGGREIGLGTVLDRDFGDSAKKYLPDDPQVDMLYAVKVARSCNGEKYCLEVKQPAQLDMYGNHYDCNPPIDLDSLDMYVGFRAYMEPGTGVGPDDNELVWDKGIYFTAKPANP